MYLTWKTSNPNEYYYTTKIIRYNFEYLGSVLNNFFKYSNCGIETNSANKISEI